MAMASAGTIVKETPVNVPIGTILPWAKNLTGVPNLPANFVECNGQTISDPDSPLNGVTLPNLNGENRFLRGNSTSGGTGGSTQHRHVTGGPSEIQKTEIGISQELPSRTHTHTTDYQDHLPPYYDVVWIIRIK